MSSLLWAEMRNRFAEQVDLSMMLCMIVDADVVLKIFNAKMKTQSLSHLCLEHKIIWFEECTCCTSEKNIYSI